MGSEGRESSGSNEIKSTVLVIFHFALNLEGQVIVSRQEGIRLTHANVARWVMPSDELCLKRTVEMLLWYLLSARTAHEQGLQCLINPRFAPTKSLEWDII